MSSCNPLEEPLAYKVSLWARGDDEAWSQPWLESTINDGGIKEEIIFHFSLGGAGGVSQDEEGMRRASR